MSEISSQQYIPRLIEEKLQKLLDSPSVVMITGARQVGKSTLMQRLQDIVNEKYSVKSSAGGFEIIKNVFSYTLDDIQLRSALRKDIRFIEKDINLALGENLYTTKKRIFVFIDEVQKFPQLFDWIKQVFDKNGKNIKFIITGSSALGLSRSVGETLAGRVEYIHVYPLIFAELVQSRLGMQKLWFKDLLSISHQRDKADSDNITDSILSQISEGDSDFSIEELEKNIFDLLQPLYATARDKERELTALLLESMFYGGLPRLYNLKLEDRIRLLRNYISVYLEKEIGFIARNIDLELFGLSLQSFASQNGGPLNINQVSKEVGVARASLYKYLDLLENTFLIKRIYPYGQGKLKDTAKSVALYYLDSGILNTLLFVNSVKEVLKPENYIRNLGSFVLLNILAVMSLFDNPVPIFYWQDYEGHRVDFIVETDDFVVAFILDKPKDARKLKATKSKFRAITPAAKPLLYVYPVLDVRNFDISFSLNKDNELENVLELTLPLQLLW